MTNPVPHGVLSFTSMKMGVNDSSKRLPIYFWVVQAVIRLRILPD
jgi:hypothetical protein